MKTRSLFILLFVAMSCTPPDIDDARSLQLGEILLLGSPVVADDAQPEAYAAYLLDEVMPAWNGSRPDFPLHAFRADRGERNGEFLLAWSGSRSARGEAGTTPYLLPAESVDAAGLTSDRAASFVADPGRYTEYELVGSETAGPLPDVELLGIHRVEIEPDLSDEFDAFVRDTLYAAFEDRAPGMRLLYYKGVRGAEAGDYILIFTFDTVERREEYFPTGQPETAALTEAFRPMTPVADGLMRYQVEGSYLDRDSGLAAAVFESVDWTDYVHLGARQEN